MLRRTLSAARDLQLQQIETIRGGAKQSFTDAEAGTSDQLSAALAMAEHYLGESSSSAISAMSVTAAAMTEGFSTMASGVTAAAKTWTQPLQDACKNFLDPIREELRYGKGEFDTRLTTIRDEFKNSARRQGNPNEIFGPQLNSVADQAVSTAKNAKHKIGTALSAGIFDRIDEEGLGDALRTLTPIQGEAVRTWWPSWQDPFDTEQGRRLYIRITGSENYSLEGHLSAVLGKGSADYNAAINYLRGDTAAGARYELEASIHWYNDEEPRIEKIMRNLTEAQRLQLQELDKATGTLGDVRSALGGTDVKVFDALNQGDHATADALRMRDELTEARRERR